MASSVVVITIKIRAITSNFIFDSLNLMNVFCSLSCNLSFYKIKSEGKELEDDRVVKKLKRN